MLRIQNGIKQQPSQQPNMIKIKHISQTNMPGVCLTRVTIDR